MPPNQFTVGATTDEFPIGDLADFLVEVTTIANERWVLSYEYDTRTVKIQSRDDVFFKRADEGGNSPPMLDGDEYRNKKLNVKYIMIDRPTTTYEDYRRRSDELQNKLDGNARKWLRYNAGSREALSRGEWMILLKYRELHRKEGPGHRHFGYQYKALRVLVEPEGEIVDYSNDMALQLQEDINRIEALFKRTNPPNQP